MTLTTETFESNGGYGYRVFGDSKLLVDQPFDHAQSGFHGYATAADAQAAADAAVAEIVAA